MASILLTLFVILSPVNISGAASAQANPTIVSHFPNSLLHIENEAFENTAFQAIFLPEGFLSIGDRAFLNTHSLLVVFIPQTTESIGLDSFPKNRNLEIHGVEKSYAEAWAREQQLRFIPDYTQAKIRMDTKTRTVHLFDAHFEKADALKAGSKSESNRMYSDRSMRPQDRPELNPIDCDFP